MESQKTTFVRYDGIYMMQRKKGVALTAFFVNAEALFESVPPAARCYNGKR